MWMLLVCIMTTNEDEAPRHQTILKGLITEEGPVAYNSLCRITRTLIMEFTMEHVPSFLGSGDYLTTGVNFRGGELRNADCFDRRGQKNVTLSPFKKIK